VLILADYYEQMVKEYLEQKGFTVRLRVRFFKTRGFSDIDVFAVNISEGKVIVGEVKTASLTNKRIDDEVDDFNDPRLQEQIKRLIGDKPYSKYIFCWSIDENTKKYALEEHEVTVIQFWEIINHFIERVRKSRQKGKWIYDQTFPNTMLLQLLYHFSIPYKGKVRVNLTQLHQPTHQKMKYQKILNENE
jgi:hypothetical protein